MMKTTLGGLGDGFASSAAVAPSTAPTSTASAGATKMANCLMVFMLRSFAQEAFQSLGHVDRWKDRVAGLASANIQRRHPASWRVLEPAPTRYSKLVVDVACSNTLPAC